MDIIYWASLVVVSTYWVYLSGRIAERRGRSFKTWAWISAVILGPLAIPLVLLLPNLHDKDGAMPKGPHGELGLARSPSLPAAPSDRSLELRHAASFGI
jgi:hypothetical protein